MSKFLQNGDVYSPTPGADSMLDNLPVGNYIVIQTMSGLMFKRVDKFTEPGRMYGNITDRAERIIKTALDRDRTTGVLLSGEKGSGKSQLARNISYAGYDLGLPTIIVNAPFAGDAFNALLATIEQPAIILMDEFEKVYSQSEDQEHVLTLLDGLMTTQKLFVLTVNDKYKVNENMKNRPGRIFYHIEFEGLESDFVREYCEDNLDDKDQLDNVLKIGALFRAFNFDMLKALVEEMNRYKEDAFDAIKMLNAKPISYSGSTGYDVTVTLPNGLVAEPGSINGLPMDNHHNAIGVVVVFKKPNSKAKFKALAAHLGYDEDDFDQPQDLSHHFGVETKSLKKIDVDNGVFEFEDEGGNKIVFKRKYTSGYDLRDIAY